MWEEEQLDEEEIDSKNEVGPSDDELGDDLEIEDADDDMDVESSSDDLE